MPNSKIPDRRQVNTRNPFPHSSIEDDVNANMSECVIDTKPIAKGKTALLGALRIGSNEEFLTWLKSDMVAPHWQELWKDFLECCPSTERGPGIAAIQENIINDKAKGEMKYTAISRDKTNWDTADHLACFVMKVIEANSASNKGVFWNRGIEEDRKVVIIWALKDWLRYIHSPSQINKPSGGTAIFGTKRKSGIYIGQPGKGFSS